MNTKDPPLDRPPFDYVPLGAPAASYKPTKWKQRNVLSRATTAGLVAAAAIGILYYVPYAWQTAVALAVVGGAVWGADKLASRLNAYDGK